MLNPRLIRQMDFIFEIEKLKTVYRQNAIINENRHENSAEHSWHIALMAFILEEYSGEKIDICKVLKMLLIHDLVEIYTGDTFLYNTSERENIKKSEKKAAQKIFAFLPEDQAEEYLHVWEEFESKQTKEAMYADVLDNLQPILNHYFTNNCNIKDKKLLKSQIIDKKKFINEFSEDLWEFAKSIIDKSVKEGLYLEG